MCFFHDGSIKRPNQKTASLWMAERVCLIPLSSQKIENGTFAWEDKRWCQSSRAGFRWGGKTQILNFSRWWLPAVTACLFTGVPIRDGEEDQLPGSVAGGFEFPANPIRRRAAWGYLLFGLVSLSATTCSADWIRQWEEKCNLVVFWGPCASVPSKDCLLSWSYNN